MIAYITKYALTQGIEKIEAEERLKGLIRDNAQYQSYYRGEGREWHRDYPSALKRAEAMKAKRITSLKKQIAKLEKMEFPEP